MFIENVIVKVDGVDSIKKFVVGVDNFGDSSINFGVWVWVFIICYYEVCYVLNNVIFVVFKNDSIEIFFL